MELGHHLEWDVRPALVAPVLPRADRYRQETVSLHWAPLRLPLALFAEESERPGWPTGDLTIFDVHTTWAFRWSAGAPLAMKATAEAIPFRYSRPRLAPWGERRDVTVDVGAGGGDFIDEGAAVRVWLVRIGHLELGPILATGGFGMASASAGGFVSDLEREVDVTTPRVLLGIETGGRHLHGQLRATRDATLAPEGHAVVDTRVAAGLRLVASRARAGLDGFLALAEVHVPGLAPRAGPTGGGSLSFTHRVAPHLDAALQLDLARSFHVTDAERAAGMLGPPRWGAQALAMLQATADR
jgi:hypothetical protein